MSLEPDLILVSKKVLVEWSMTYFEAGYTTAAKAITDQYARNQKDDIQLGIREDMLEKINNGVFSDFGRRVLNAKRE